MLKDRLQASKFFITADLGASCLGWLAGFFAFAVLLSLGMQYKLIELPEILRLFAFQIFLTIALISVYRRGWRPKIDISIFSWLSVLGWLVIYFGCLKLLDIIAMNMQFHPNETTLGLKWSAPLFVSVILAPIIEELFFRDLLFRTFLSRWPKFWMAIFISSFFFMIAHQSFYVGAMVLGVINAFLFIFSQSVLPGIIFHSISNLSVYFLPIYFPALTEALRDGGLLYYFYRS